MNKCIMEHSPFDDDFWQQCSDCFSISYYDVIVFILSSSFWHGSYKVSMGNPTQGAKESSHLTCEFDVKC